MKKEVLTAKDFISQSEELKSKRLLMGLKAVDFCNDHKLNQGNYSKMERGLGNPESALVIMTDLFKCWKKDRIEQLTKEINYLKSLS